MSQDTRTSIATVRTRNLIKMPASVCEESGFDIKGSKVKLHWGKNYQCVVITPADEQLGRIQQERIQKLVTEPLKTDR